MICINFNDISSKYQDISLVQASAGDVLIKILDIKGNENVLDVGCGTGNITRKIRHLTIGKVVGVDSSEGMIRKAMDNYPGDDLLFEVKTGEEINESLGKFDVIFCNSTFQWFKNPEFILKNFFSVLNKEGRLGVQVPATLNYCPNFIAAIDEIKKNPITSRIFENFKSPWFFLETSEEYQQLFENAGFSVVFSKIEKPYSKVTPEDTLKIFSSGAIAGYLDEKNYLCPVNEEYVENFKEIVKSSFESQVNSDGMVDLIFHRIFVIAEMR